MQQQQEYRAEPYQAPPSRPDEGYYYVDQGAARAAPTNGEFGAQEPGSWASYGLGDDQALTGALLLLLLLFAGVAIGLVWGKLAERTRLDNVRSVIWRLIDARVKLALEATGDKTIVAAQNLSGDLVKYLGPVLLFSDGLSKAKKGLDDAIAGKRASKPLLPSEPEKTWEVRKATVMGPRGAPETPGLVSEGYVLSERANEEADLVRERIALTRQAVEAFAAYWRAEDGKLRRAEMAKAQACLTTLPAGLSRYATSPGVSPRH